MKKLFQCLQNSEDNTNNTTKKGEKKNTSINIPKTLIAIRLFVVSSNLNVISNIFRLQTIFFVCRIAWKGPLKGPWQAIGLVLR